MCTRAAGNAKHNTEGQKMKNMINISLAASTKQLP